MRYLMLAGALGLALIGHGLWDERRALGALTLRAYSTVLYAIGHAAGHVVRSAVLAGSWSAHAVSLGFDDAVGPPAEPVEAVDGELVFDELPVPPMRIRNR